MLHYKSSDPIKSELSILVLMLTIAEKTKRLTHQCLTSRAFHNISFIDPIFMSYNCAVDSDTCFRSASFLFLLIFHLNV
jgi:hypothetical protein